VTRRLEKSILIVVMCAGCLLMWTAVPAAWLWIAGRFARVSQSEMSSFAILYAGTTASMTLVGMVLGRIDRRYTARFEPAMETRVTGARWLHSLRGGRDEEPVTPLDKIMIVNVALALLTALVWFALFSHGSQARL
jgi:hypothetical protein